MANTKSPATHRTAESSSQEPSVSDTTTTARSTRSNKLPLSHPRLPRWAGWLVAGLAAAASAIVTMTLGWGLVGWGVLAIVLFGVALPAWSLLVENRRAAKDRLVSTLVWVAFALAVLPLVSLLATVVENGLQVINAQFLTYSMRNVIGEGGGVYHAIIGTLLITVAAAVISVPIGIMTAICLVEYGAGSKVARAITFLVDVMTGIPSIVAGLFAYALFALVFGPGVRMGIGGSVALS
ncbi:MAG TPA: hypothetical protein VFP51_11840, partial [Nocardioidaceae bacterium]|nr:hypothetical protein [Nocardioidaceae bacterium]